MRRCLLAKKPTESRRKLVEFCFAATAYLGGLVRSRQAQALAILNHSRALPQRDGYARPASAGRVIGSERDFVILDTGDVLDDALAVRCPRIDAEGEMRSGCHHGSA